MAHQSWKSFITFAVINLLGTEGLKTDGQDEANQRSRRSVDESLSRTTPYFIEAHVVIDGSVFPWFDVTKDNNTAEIIGNITENILEVMKNVDQAYSEVGIRVVFSGLEIWEGEAEKLDNRDKIENVTKFATDHLNTLRSLQSKRSFKDRTSPWEKADVIIVMYGNTLQYRYNIGTCKFQVGIAYTDTICQAHTPVAIVQMKTDANTTALVAVHEIGHILGIPHLPWYCEDRNVNNYMSRSMSGDCTNTQWSSCTKDNVAALLEIPERYHCLQNVPQAPLYSAPSCGNEIVESGEQCDCGTPETCQSKCCDPHTCQFLARATCDGGACCDECKFKQRASLCKGDFSQCSLPSYCDGNSSSCPIQLWRRDGASCLNDDGVCKNGECITHNRQCQFLYGEASEACYQTLENMNPARDKQCKKVYKEDRKNYEKCKIKWAQKDLCKHLWCNNVDKNHRVRDFKYLTFRNIDNDRMIHRPMPAEQCFRFDGNTVLWYAQDGMKCGDDMICRRRNCTEDPLRGCENKCSGHGICNNNGTCHCDIGYQPPFCDRPGIGGSVETLQIRDSYCGNDFVEENEECDCGHPDKCTSKCCDPLTCKFKPRRSVCRAGTGYCNPRETCDGISAQCPADRYVMDGSDCGKMGTCYNKTCRSRLNQCKKIFGPVAQISTNECYRKNWWKGAGRMTSSLRLGNCGRDEQGHLVKCAISDRECGKLMCNDRNSTVQFDGYRRVRFVAIARDQNNLRIKARCTTALTHLIKPQNGGGVFGLVADGIRCATNKVCINQKCTKLDSNPQECALNRCNGHGVCYIHHGCLCDAGFRPPFCLVPN